MPEKARLAFRAHKQRLAATAFLVPAQTVWNGRARARRLIPVTSHCDLAHIGGCQGRIARAHVNHDPLHNTRDNLLMLCDSHHRLYDNGTIDLENPVMPKFYVDARGRRRYQHSYERYLESKQALTAPERRRAKRSKMARFTGQ